MDLEGRGAAGMSPCGLSGLCAGALSSAWVGCQSLWEHLSVALGINLGFIALRGSACKCWHYLCCQLSGVRPLLPSTCHTSCLPYSWNMLCTWRQAWVTPGHLQNCPAWPRSPPKRGSLSLSPSTLNFIFKPHIGTMGFLSCLVLSVA